MWQEGSRERSLVGMVGVLVMVGLDSRTVRPAARRDAWTQSPCCSAESDGTSAHRHTHTQTHAQLGEAIFRNCTLLLLTTK